MSLPTYENKVLTGDKLTTLVSLIKGELNNKLAAADLDSELCRKLAWYQPDDEREVNPQVENSFADAVKGLIEAYIRKEVGDELGIEDDPEENPGVLWYPSNLIEALTSLIEGQVPTDPIGDIIAELGYADDTLQDAIEKYLVNLLEGTPGTDTLLNTLYARIGYSISDSKVVTEDNVGTYISFNTAYNATTNKVATMADIPDISGKQDTLVFNTAYNASSNKVATMSDVSGKQDALVFNTAYNASSNKVATMADIPSVSAFQTASDVQTAITTALSGITSFSFEIVQALPQSNISQTTIYLVLKSSGSSGNIYTEYAYVKTGTDAQTGNDIYGWETLGDTQADIATLTTAEVQTLWSNTPADPGL